jgi:hypothetical protein
MTSWKHHHPPHDHPDFDAYLDTLTDDDHPAIEATNDTTLKIHNEGAEPHDDF